MFLAHSYCRIVVPGVLYNLYRQKLKHPLLLFFNEFCLMFSKKGITAGLC